MSEQTEAVQHRRPDEIRADISQLFKAVEGKRDKKGNPKKPHGVALGALRRELIDSLEAQNLELAELVVAERRKAEGAMRDPGSDALDGETEDQLLSRMEKAPSKFDRIETEQDFIDRCCAEVDLPPGQLGAGVAKKFYQRVATKIRIWRMMRELMGEIGLGAPLPSWPMLGRDDDTGERKEKEEEPEREVTVDGPDEYDDEEYEDDEYDDAGEYEEEDADPEQEDEWGSEGEDWEWDTGDERHDTDLPSVKAPEAKRARKRKRKPRKSRVPRSARARVASSGQGGTPSVEEILSRVTGDPHGPSEDIQQHIGSRSIPPERGD